MIKIDSGYKMPEGREKYPFKKMKVGQSFAIPKGKEASVRSSAYNQKSKKFRVLANGDGLRCWRIK